MRTEAFLGILLVLTALPAAAALEDQTIAIPDVYARVEGTSIDAGEKTARYTGDAPVGVEGEVGVKDAEVSLDGPACTVGAKAEAEDLDESCRTGSVQASDATTLINANVGLRLGALDAAEEAPEEEDLATSGATVAAAPVSGAALLVAAAAGASAAGLYALWRLLKWTGLAAILPLYSHISDDEILDDPNRAAIYRLIQTEAGISTKDIAERLGLAWGTVTHHLAKLEKRRFVVSKKYGKYRRYFANGEGGTDRKDAVAVLRLDRTGDVAALIQRQPGLTQKAVSQALGVSSSTILWHVKRLEEVQLVRKVREGKIVRYYPADGLADNLVMAPPAQAA